MLFYDAYGRLSSHSLNEPRSIMDSILGNIGEPLRVDDEYDELIDKHNNEESTEMRKILH